MKNLFNLSLLIVLLLTCSILGCQISEYDNSDFNSELKRYDNCTNGVASTYPADGDENVSIDTTISVNFCIQKDPNLVTTNTYDSSCAGILTGDILVSSDDFSTCLKMQTVPFASKANKTFTVLPSSNLSYNTTYKIRVRTNQYESSTGFKTATPQPFVVVSNSGEILTSTDGISWDNKSTSISSEITCSGGGNNCRSIEGVASKGNGTYITTTIGFSNKMAKTSDGGLTWSLINSGINSLQKIFSTGIVDLF